MELIVISKEDLEEIVQNSVSKALAQYFIRKEEKAKIKDFLTVKEAAVYLGVSELSIRNYIKKGYIKAERIGSRIRISKIEIENALKEVKSLKYKR